MLSVILPSYNEEDNISNTAAVISRMLEENKIEYELIFVDDGSRDASWEVICKESKKNRRVRGVRFSRNFGKEGAIFAGLKAAVGDCAVVMDCDLQHPPQTVLEMYDKWLNGAEVVEGKKRSRGKESSAYGGLSKLFYKLIKSASGIDMIDTSDFKLLDRKVINALLDLPERITFFRALSGWVGFKTETVWFDVAPRAFGERKWTTKMLLGYAIRNLSSFTGMPLYISTILGLFIILAAVVIWILLLCGVNLSSFNAANTAILFVMGLILETVGILSYYVSRIYEEIKNRPRYIVSNTTDEAVNIPEE